MNHLFSLKNKHCLITGGASGLGLEIAKGFAQSGANISLLDVNKDSLEEAKQIFNGLGFDCDIHCVDITKWSELMVVSERITDLDVLVNCAGINIRKRAMEMDSEEYVKVINVNLIGTFNCCKIFGEKLLEKKSGSIINVASIHAHSTMTKQSAYASTKGGVLQLTKVLALEFAEQGVRVNALSPGFHFTPLVEELKNDKKWYEDIISKIPMKKFANAEEIVGPALFLAADASSYVTGISLISDGGYLAQ